MKRRWVGSASGDARALLCALILCGLGCEVPEGISVRLDGVAPFDNDCVASAEATRRINEVFYDPSGLAALKLGIVLNNVASTVESIGGSGPQPSDAGFNVGARNFEVLGFDLCFERSAVIAAQSGGRLDCDAVAEQQQHFVPASATLDEQTTQVAVVISAIDVSDLKTIYGDGFEPENIPAEGPYGVDIDGNGSVLDVSDVVFVSFDAENPASENRSAAWGSFVQTPSDAWTVQYRGLLRNADGKSLHTEWESVQVNVCPRCVHRECGDFEPLRCTGTCGTSGAPEDCPEPSGAVTGEQCLLTDDGCAALCSDGRDCAAYAFSGNRFNGGACLPYQGVQIECVAFDACQ